MLRIAHSVAALAIGAGLALAAGCSTGGGPARGAAASSAQVEATPAQQRPRLVRKKPFPEAARKVLRERMLRHGSDMESLLWATIQLDYVSTAEIATRIASEPRIPRPTSGPQDPLAGLLPDEYFDLQDQLERVAHSLADAAKAEDDAAMAAAYGQLTKTCISCHSLYLRIEPTPAQ